MIVITGAAGFIASNLVRALVKNTNAELLLVDHFPTDKYSAKADNIAGFEQIAKMDRDNFLEWFTDNAEAVDFVFHLGARTDTSEFDFRVLDSLNLSYSMNIWEVCTIKQIPIVYASSAATYGMGNFGFDDDEEKIPLLQPLNPYGLSKQLFDAQVIGQTQRPPFWAGLKFFNVYGPYEAHKGRMASVVFHAYNQIKETGKLKLFESHKAEFNDGEQLRDFIYVDDVINVCLYMYHNRPNNGIYNVGTGKARTFNDLGRAVFKAMGQEENIEYIPIPTDIRDKYQYFTEAKMDKLISTGYNDSFMSLEEGIKNYIGFLSAIQP
jgi:ADP-L-glycero-D-manno-heptose 6-epimerase